MKINSLIQFHINKLLALSSLCKAQEYLMNNGFIRIGCGCESVVYSKVGFEYVIKIQFSAFTHSGSKKDIPSSKHFTNQVVYKGEVFNVIVQEKIEKVYGDMKGTRDKPIHKRFKKFVEFVEKNFGVSDIHVDNVGLNKGRFVVFDWTIN